MRERAVWLQVDAHTGKFLLLRSSDNETVWIWPKLLLKTTLKQAKAQELCTDPKFSQLKKIQILLMPLWLAFELQDSGAVEHPQGEHLAFQKHEVSSLLLWVFFASLIRIHRPNWIRIRNTGIYILYILSICSRTVAFLCHSNLKFCWHL